MVPFRLPLVRWLRRPWRRLIQEIGVEHSVVQSTDEVWAEPLDPSVVSGLVSGIDALVDTDPGILADEDSLIELSRQLDRLEAVVTRVTARFDAEGGYAGSGARSTASWVSNACHLPVATARRRVRLGRALRHMAMAEESWLGGDICSAHVAALDSVRTPATDTAFDRDQAMLVGQAVDLRYGAFARALAYWAQFADPDGTEDRSQADYDSRSLHLSQSFGGRWCLDGLFDPIGGSIIANELRRIEDELFNQDWAQAKTRLGREPHAGDLERTPPQRRADAMVEMARRSAALPGGSRLPEPLFSVLVGYETLAGRICQLANGTAISPGSLIRWGNEAWIERIVFDTPSRVIDVGQRRRLFAGATRRAVQVRDQQCFHDFCDTPADRCDIDHVMAYSDGGLTTEANGRVACGFHNRQRNHDSGRSRDP